MPLALLLALPLSEARAAWLPGHSSGMQGSRDYALYVPARKPSALVLFLHGCNESPEEFAQGARIAQYAEERGSLILLPKQDTRDNPERCWNWFVPQNQWRDTGEEGLLASMTREIIQSYPEVRSHVFVAGLSAGGAMANVLASCHPELFSGVAIHSGMPFRAASDPVSALWSVAHGSAVVGSSRVDLQACKLEYSIVSPK